MADVPIAVSTDHCKNGHPYTEESLLITSMGYTACRICHKQRNRAWRERSRQKGGT